MMPRLLLTSLEEYFLREDRQAYPWSFFVRLDFIGRADRPMAEKALRACVARHPLLSSVVGREGRALVWQPVDNPMPAVHWTTAPVETAYLPATRLDVREEIGVRVHFAVGPETTRVIFQFHHACCDARGATGFIGDWLAEYGRAAGDAADYGTPRFYDPAVPERWKCPSPAVQGPIEALRMRGAGLVRAARFLTRPPAPLVDYRPARDGAATPPGYPNTCHYRLDEQTTSELRAAAKRRGATVNDLLCWCLFLAMRDFRREMGQRPKAWLRIVVPVDLRTEIHRNMSAANLTSMVFLTRHAAAGDHPAALLQGIHDEMGQVKRWRLARTFLRGLQIGRYLPGGLARGVHNGKCRGTATMTNLGEIFAGAPLPRRDGRLVAGNLLLDSADFLAPVRPLTCASFSASTYAGRLSLNLHYDPSGLAEASAIRLFDTLLGQVRSNCR